MPWVQDIGRGYWSETSDNVAGYKYVAYCEDKDSGEGKYQLRMTLKKHGGQQHLGTFDTAIEAALSAAKRLANAPDAPEAIEKQPDDKPRCSRPASWIGRSRMHVNY